jgi:hypothetical protein
MMKSQVDILDAVPAKGLFLSIIADYDLNKSICELVDNGFDVWTRAGRKKPININVELDVDENVIRVEDDAGGLKYSELRYIVSPGQSGSSSTDETIGIFGVGTKRAVVALARDIVIRTRYDENKTYQVEFDETWLADEDWALPVYAVSDINPGTTQVLLRSLRLKLNNDVVRQLCEHLEATYGKFVSQEGVTLKVNDEVVQPRFFEEWSFPPGYEPRHYSGQLRTPKDRIVQVDVTAGLSSESSPTAGAYGVYFYCNQRLVAPAMKSFDVGFTKGQAGLPHPKIALTKVIVSLQGDASEMPWNSSKSDISTKHHVFVALHDWLVTVVADYAQISRIWMGDWPDKVFAYPQGEIINIPIEEAIRARKSFLPDPPKSRPRLAERIATKNKQLSSTKPWVKGLYEGMVAANTIAKQPVGQANWFSFNLLHLTLISALKNYIVNESETTDSGQNLREVLRLTPKISDDLKKLVPLSEAIWIQVQNFARRREDLMYDHSTPSIPNYELNEIEQLLQAVLAKLFSIELE